MEAQSPPKAAYIRRQLCAVEGCPGTSRLYNFPRFSKELTQLWCKNIGIDPDRLNRNSHVCRIHFEDKCLDGSRLRMDAIPTMFLGHLSSVPHPPTIDLLKPVKHKCLACGIAGIPLVKIPADSDIRHMWLRSLGVEGVSEESAMLVCEKHFPKGTKMSDNVCNMPLPKPIDSEDDSFVEPFAILNDSLTCVEISSDKDADDDSDNGSDDVDIREIDQQARPQIFCKFPAPNGSFFTIESQPPAFTRIVNGRKIVTSKTFVPLEERHLEAQTKYLSLLEETSELKEKCDFLVSKNAELKAKISRKTQAGNDARSTQSATEETYAQIYARIITSENKTKYTSKEKYLLWTIYDKSMPTYMLCRNVLKFNLPSPETVRSWVPVTAAGNQPLTNTTILKTNKTI